MKASNIIKKRLQQAEKLFSCEFLKISVFIKFLGQLPWRKIAPQPEN